MVDATTGEGKTPKAKSLAQTSFPDMPKDKSLKAKAAKNNETPISDIAKKSKKNLVEVKDPVALPPFTSGLVNAAKAIGAAGGAAIDQGGENNSNNPKAKSLLATEDDEATIKSEKAKGEAKLDEKAAKK